jgi:tubulin monoglycylase TTLL15
MVERSKHSFFLILKIFFTIFIALFSFLVAKYYSKFNEHVASERKLVIPIRTLKYWGVCVKRWNPNGNLRSMNKVFRKLGYKFVNPTKGDDWDFLWSIEYPFISSIYYNTSIFDEFINNELRLEQRVNHIPGSQYFTNKMRLALETKSAYLLPTFKFPELYDEFHEFVKENPGKRFVRKNYNNRGVRIINIEEIDYEDEDKVYQVFLNNPYLIDGHAFDFGVYVLISSINPLRVYRYSHEVFIRFCPEEYHPFDEKNLKKYVVDESHLSCYDMPSFENSYFKYGYSFQYIFEHIIRQKGFDIENLWAKIDDAISSIILQNEKFMIETVG